MYTLTVPLVISAFVKSTWLAALITFISVCTYWTLNEVAQDLEDPFWYDPNNLPLAYYQYAFNERIIVISRTKRPLSNTEKTALSRRTNMPVTLAEQVQVSKYAERNRPVQAMKNVEVAPVEKLPGIQSKQASSSPRKEKGDEISSSQENGIVQNENENAQEVMNGQVKDDVELENHASGSD
eukprot:TRINITY_DN647_c0_g1_i12.p2 TRINITY_DN647_c0_g1~~TRINITY_DN647_c0_g1_i12.p2  ORF type:complete len:182 (-),score=20.45 TRINITY_DN647_c0_g1_i12:1126-1671(-)